MLTKIIVSLSSSGLSNSRCIFFSKFKTVFFQQKMVLQLLLILANCAQNFLDKKYMDTVKKLALAGGVKLFCCGVRRLYSLYRTGKNFGRFVAKPNVAFVGFKTPIFLHLRIYVNERQNFCGV